MCALVCTVSKLKPEPFSACQFAFALAMLTNEMPTLACTTWLVVVLKVRKIVFGPDWIGGFDANDWSKTMSK